MTAYCSNPADHGCASYLDRIAARCKERGAALTPIRRSVLELLYHSENGLKAYDLLARFKELRPNATPPTVYRALDFLIEQELVHKISRLNQFVVCHHESHCRPGLFLVCRRCGKISELDDCALADALTQSVRAAGHALDLKEVEISSICPACKHTHHL